MESGLSPSAPHTSPSSAEGRLECSSACERQKVKMLAQGSSGAPAATLLFVFN